MLQISREFREFASFDIFMLGFPEDAQFSAYNDITPQVLTELQLDPSQLEPTAWLQNQRQFFIKTALFLASSCLGVLSLLWFVVNCVSLGSFLAQNALLRSEIHEKTAALEDTNTRFQRIQRYTELPSVHQAFEFLQQLSSSLYEYPIDLTDVTLDASKFVVSGRFWSLSKDTLFEQLSQFEADFTTKFNGALSVQIQNSTLKTTDDWVSVSVTFSGDFHEVLNAVASSASNAFECNLSQSFASTTNTYRPSSFWDATKERVTSLSLENFSAKAFNTLTTQDLCLTFRENSESVDSHCGLPISHEFFYYNVSLATPTEAHCRSNATEKASTADLGFGHKALQFVFSTLNSGFDVFSRVATASEGEISSRLEPRIQETIDRRNRTLPSDANLEEDLSFNSQRTQQHSELQQSNSSREFEDITAKSLSRDSGFRESEALGQPEVLTGKSVTAAVDDRPIVTAVSNIPADKEKALRLAYKAIQQRLAQTQQQLQETAARQASELRNSTSFNPQDYQLTKFYSDSIVLSNTTTALSYRIYLNDTYTFNGQLFELVEIIPGKKSCFLCRGFW